MCNGRLVKRHMHLEDFYSFLSIVLCDRDGYFVIARVFRVEVEGGCGSGGIQSCRGQHRRNGIGIQHVRAGVFASQFAVDPADTRATQADFYEDDQRLFLYGSRAGQQ